jgi:hypothetical protein
MRKIAGELEVVSILSDPFQNIPQYKRNGLWRARVVNNIDPEARGRLQVRILHLHMDESFSLQMLSPTSNKTAVNGSAAAAPEGGLTPLSATTAPPPAPMVAMAGVKNEHCPWAEPAFPWGGKLNQGFFAIPEVGSTVWVGFEMGYTAYPVWLGAWYGALELPVEINPVDPSKVRLMKTPDGKLMLFDDDPANSRILIMDHPAVADEDVGYIEISKTNGTLVIHRGKYSTLTYSRVTMADDYTDIEVRGTAANRSKVTMTPVTIQSQQITGAAVATVDLIGGNATVTTTGNVTLNVTGNVIVNAVNTTITTSGNVVLDSTGDATINAVNADINASGTVSLGSGAALGVMLDAMILKFNNHVHNHPAGLWPEVYSDPPEATNLLVAGTDSSLTVTAKV